MLRPNLALVVLALGIAVGAHAEPPTAVPPRAGKLEEPTGPLQLATALALALLHNPRLASDSRAVRAGEAEALQAAALPNPIARFELEDVGASAPFAGVDQAQVTVSLAQLIELGGKRAARVRDARVGTELAAWDYERRRMDVLTATAQAFTEVLAQQQRQTLSQELVTQAETVVGKAEERRRMGAAPSTERTRAEITLAAARIEAAQAGRALAAARQQLVATWGGTRARFDRAVGTLDEVRPLPQLEDLEARLARNPDLARWASEIARRDSALAVERSLAVPNVTVEAGYRRLFGPDGNTFVTEVAFPLPVFDRNQGGILAAQHRLEQARDQQMAAEADVRTQLADAYAALAGAHDEVRIIDVEVLPRALEVFAAVSQAFREGRTGALEILDAQRVLITGRVQRLRALASYHQAAATLERLVGEPLEPRAEVAGGEVSHD